jgi:predicted PurR-regulated permease PerM
MPDKRLVVRPLALIIAFCLSCALMALIGWLISPPSIASAGVFGCLLLGFYDLAKRKLPAWLSEQA